jgi:hypothetical protein
MPFEVKLAPGAEENGLATMLGNLVRQNLESHPTKQLEFTTLFGIVAVVADDADVAVTLQFSGGELTVHDGIWQIPDITIRGPSDAIIALSNVPSTTALKLPIPRPGDREALGALRTIWRAARSGKLRIYGAFFNAPLMLKVGHVLSVN